MKGVELRKAIKLGKATLAVTLPKEWVRAVGLRENDLLAIREEQNKLIIEKTTDKEKFPVTCIIKPEVCIKEEGMLMRMIIGAYTTGYDIIYIPIKNDSSIYIEEAKKAIKKLIGAYISEMTPDNIIINIVTDSSKPDINSSLMRLHTLIHELLDIANNMLKKDNYMIDNMLLNEIYDEFNKTYLLAVRQLLKSQHDRTLANKIGIKINLWIVGNRASLILLKTIFYYIRDLIDIVDKIKLFRQKIDDEMINTIINISSSIKDLSEKCIMSLITIDATLANATIINADNLRRKIDELLELLAEKPSKVYPKIMLSCFMRNIKGIANCYKFIAEISLNRATEFTNKYIIKDTGF